MLYTAGKTGLFIFVGKHKAAGALRRWGVRGPYLRSTWTWPPARPWQPHRQACTSASDISLHTSSPSAKKMGCERRKETRQDKMVLQSLTTWQGVVTTWQWLAWRPCLIYSWNWLHLRDKGSQGPAWYLTHSILFWNRWHDHQWCSWINQVAARIYLEDALNGNTKETYCISKETCLISKETYHISKESYYI